MLSNAKDFYGSKLVSLDGDIGHAKDFYFDDQSWVIRYLVADTGSWLTGRLVLLTPHAFGRFDPAARILSVDLHQKQIEGSPLIDAHRPVSRQYELDYYRYYGWPAYWEGDAMWGLGGYPTLPAPPDAPEPPARHRHRDDKHLQSTLAVTGYAIQSTDGPIGRVTGFMIDDRSWAIREIVVETGHWYAGKEVLISPGKVRKISYEDSLIFVDLSQADIRHTTEHTMVHAGSDHPPGAIFPTE